ncbi:hypothetical protein [Hydrogenispora ethanolica]|uniref:hypothetical protein n=1 Tax=Hydrogenispora ethanolica TaxID=1082276 RepID=UPI001404B14C|nr:hypothetical protein [Hydrogenispora ethanolica]
MLNPLRHLEAIKCRLIAENAKDLSDNELYRCLSGCVGAHMLIPLAIKYRDDGYLNL